MASSVVEIRVVGSQALRELQGVERRIDSVAKTEQKAAAAVEKAAKQAAAAQAKQAEKARAAVEAAAKKMADAKTREAKKAADRELRIAEKTAKDLANLEKKQIADWEAYQRKLTQIAAIEAAKRAKQEEKNAKARDKDRSKAWRTAGGVLGGAIGGAFAGGMSAVSTARNIAGVQDVGSRIQNANAGKEQLILTASAARLSREQTEGLLKNVTGTAEKKAVPTADLVDGLRFAHEQFNALQFVSDNLEELAGISKATGTDFRDLVGQVGSMRNAFGEKGIMQELYRSLGMSDSGALSAAAFAGPMSAAMGNFAGQTGRKDAEGARQFSAMMQTIAAVGYDAEATETRGTQFVNSLNRDEIIEDLKALDVEYTPGNFDVFDVVNQIAKNPKLQGPEQLSAVFHDLQARQGLEALLMQNAKYNASFTPGTPGGNPNIVGAQTMLNVTPEQGKATVAETTARLEDAGLLDLQRQAIEAENEVIKHLGEYNEQILKVTDATMRLEKAFGPTASLWGTSVLATGAGAAGGSIAGSMALKALGLGGGAAGATTAAGASAAGGAAASPMAALAAGLGTGAASVGAGLAGYYGATALGADRLGEDLGKWLYGDEDDPMRRDAVKTELSIDVNLNDNRTEVKARAKSTDDKYPAIRIGSGPLLPGSL